jgi:predicted dehydrogenase
MTKRNRRQFLEESMLAAAATAAAVSGVDDLLADPLPRVRDANDRLGVAVVGTRGRGNSHLGFFASQRDLRVLYVCDVDRQIGPLRAEQTARRQGGAPPAWVADLRHVLDDPRVDIVSVATPNHWHALAAIWAMQAGKHVYVEMPVSHNIWEGCRMVEVARRQQRICQSGLQARSNPGMRAAIQYVQSGGIGTVNYARGVCYRQQRPFAPVEVAAVPEHIDYDLWLGPAPQVPLTRQRFHYDWRWQWAYGNGEMGNQAVHQLDLCRWGLQLQSLGHSALSYASCVDDSDRDPGRWQVSLHTAGQWMIVQETRCTTRRPRGVPAGVIFEGTDGYVVLTSYHSGTAFDLKGHPVRHFRGGGGRQWHFTNFVEAIRLGSCLHLHADIEEGHLSSALMHAGNISCRLGQEVPLATAQTKLAGLDIDGPLSQMPENMARHSGASPHDGDDSSVRLGSLLHCDGVAEQFSGNPQANLMLTRDYRPPYVVPDIG